MSIGRPLRLPGSPVNPLLFIALLAALALGHAVSLFATDWGATADETYVDTRSDTVHTGTIDQQYLFHANGDILPTVSYFTSLTYHHLRTNLGRGGSLWQSEMMPAISAVWNSPFFRLRSGYSYRDNRDQQNVNELTGRAADVNVQSVWESLPRLTGRYEWQQNVNDLELLGNDTRQRIIAGAADYSFATTTLRYEYSDSRTENHRTGFSETLRSHVGRFENSLSALNHLLNLQTSYLLTVKTEQNRQPTDDGILAALTPVAGIWAVNPTPQLGALISLPTLIDANFDSAASRQLNLSGSDVLNLGLDFGSAVSIDHIFLYTDSLANAGLRWSVYTSSDNYNWSAIQDFRSFSFNVVFRRYEVTFPLQVTRHIKLVLEPQPLLNPVYVTEIRGLLVRSQTSGSHWATDHQAAVRLGIQPAKWLFGSVEGTLIRNGASATTIARQQDGLNGSLSFAPGRLLRLSGQYQLSRTEYPDVSGGRTDSKVVGFTLMSRWLSSLRSTVSGSRQEESSVSALSRRLDSGSLRLDASLLPGLGSTSEAGLSQDRRFVDADLYKSRYIGQSVVAQPTESLQLTADYRYFWLSSQRGGTPPYRENVAAQGTYRVTKTLQLTGNATRYREAGKIYTTWQTLLDWSATAKMTLSAGALRILPDVGSNTLLLTGQVFFRWSERSSVTASYSRLTSEQSAQENFSNLRFGFTFRI